MSRCLLVPPGGDLVREAASLLMESGRPLERCLVVFPGRRPAHFLRRELAGSLGRAFRPPRILSMDDWAAGLSESVGHCGRRIEALEAAAILAGLCGRAMPGGRPMPLDKFLPWGFKLFSDLEELKMGLVDPARLKSFDAIAGERLPPRMQDMLSDLSGLYRRFYGTLASQGLVTRSSTYAAAAAAVPADYDLVVLAGFFGPTAAEEAILESHGRLGQTVFLLKDGPGMGELLDRLRLDPQRQAGEDRRPEVRYYPAPDTVGQAMALNLAIEGSSTAGRAVVLPAAEALFPVADHVLGRFGGDWNVSLGYPLSRTPVMALISGIGRMLDTEADGRLHAPEYLSVLLHPYVKNLRMAAEPRITRMLCHAVGERLSQSQARYVDPAWLEEDAGLAERLASLAGPEDGMAAAEAGQILGGIHQLTVRNFDRIICVGDFAAKLLELVETVAERGTAQKHPYAASFLECAAGELNALARGPLAPLSLGDRRAYFSFIEAALAPARVPYPGTPLKGLQVLGFLETRNLCFEEVFVLDANEGVLPPQRPVETLLPQALRMEMGLPDHSRAEAAMRYHFHSLLAGARRAHLFYSRGRGGEPSRFIEELWWEEQKRDGGLGIGGLRPVHFAASFEQRSPAPAQKTAGILETLRSRAFSASSLDAYLRCPLQFLYSKVLGLEAAGGAGTDLDQTQVGSLVHRALNEFFGERIDCPPKFGRQDFARMEQIVGAQFLKTFGAGADGRLALARIQVENRMRSLLESERARSPVVRCCERELAGRLSLADGRQVAIKGTIDRIEEQGGRTNIIDYKTGGSARLPQKGFDPAQRDRWHRTMASVQLPLYYELYRQNFPLSPGGTDCGLMLLGSKSFRIEWLFQGRESEAEALHSGYLKAIAGLIDEILDPSLPFAPAPDPQSACPSCDFKVMCGRQWLAG